MMKKYALVLALALLFVLRAAIAEDVEFSIRGGIKWGMSGDDVLAIEAGNYYDNSLNAAVDEGGETRKQFIEDVLENGHAAFGNGASLINPDSGKDLTLLVAQSARVSRYEADVIFIFRNDELVAFLYGFSECDPDNLRTALEMKYGEFTDDGYDEFDAAMRYIIGDDMMNMYDEYAKESEHKLLENGTFIHSVLIEGAYWIMYQDMNTPWNEIVYDLYGL